MMKLERRRKIVIINKRRFILSIIVLVTVSCLLFYIGSKENNIIPANAQINLKKSVPNPKKLKINSSNRNIYKSDGHKIAYLTFDDGPSSNTTPKILRILDDYNIKATFFILGSNAIIRPDLVRMEVKDGQSIGNHTYSHEYKYIYSNTNAFIRDINKCDTLLKSIIGSGYNSKLLRFPGGSFGAKMAPFRVSIKKAGYHYVDWNDLTGDSEGQNISVNKLLNNIKNYTKEKEHVVILMHDALECSGVGISSPASLSCRDSN